MGLNYDHLNILRFIQKKQKIHLSLIATRFKKNESSIRRSIEQINSHIETPLIKIITGYCISTLTYREFVHYIQSIKIAEYDSSQQERLRVLVISIFFNGYVNTTALYDDWNFSITTKKKDTAVLRTLLSTYSLVLNTVPKKGLRIDGDELNFRFLVIDSLLALFEFNSDMEMTGRLANTPFENICFNIASSELNPFVESAVTILNTFLDKHSLALNYSSKKFMLLFICIMKFKPLLGQSLSKPLPLPPLNMEFDTNQDDNFLYNIALSLLSFSPILSYPHDNNLWQQVRIFASHIANQLNPSFEIGNDILTDLYQFFYREIMLNFFHFIFYDKYIENVHEEFPILYSVLQNSKFSINNYELILNNEQTTTLTLLIQKYILRSQLIDSSSTKIVILTSINFERISFFLEQIKEHIELECVSTLNISEINLLKNLDYDVVICFSSRIYNILLERGYPAVQINFFVNNHDIDILMSMGFKKLRHRFKATEFTLEIAGMSTIEMEKYLKENYANYFL